MDLRYRALPGAINCKLRVVAAPFSRIRPLLASRKVKRVVCSTQPQGGQDGTPAPPLVKTLVRNASAAALIGVATTALVGTPSSIASLQPYVGSSAGQSKAQQASLERIIQERNGGQRLSNLLNAQQASARPTPVALPRVTPFQPYLPSVTPLPRSTTPAITNPTALGPSTTPLSLASAPGLGAQSTISTSNAPASVSTATAPPPSATTAAASTNPLPEAAAKAAGRPVWTLPSVGQLPLQLAAMGTTLTVDSGAIAQELTGWAQPGLASISASVNALRDSSPLESTMSQAGAGVSDLVSKLGSSVTVVVDKGASASEIMTSGVYHAAGSLGTMTAGAAHGFQSGVANFGSRLGESMSGLVANIEMGSSGIAAMSVGAAEKFMGAGLGQGVLACVVASGTAFGTIGLASKRRLEAQNMELQLQLERLTTEHDAGLAGMQRRIADLQDSLAAVESRLAFTTHDYDTKLAEAGLELTRLGEQREQERQKLLHDLETARLERQQLNAEAETIRQQLEVAHVQWSEREAECRQLEHELSIAVSERVALRNVLQQLQESSHSQLSAAAAMEETYSTRLGSLERQIQQLETALHSAEKGLEDTEQELQEVLEVNMELHENLDDTTSKHATQLARLEQDWSQRITDMENKYISRLCDIEEEYETRLTETEAELKKTKTELESVSGLANTTDERLIMLQQQLQEVTALKKELEDSHQTMERTYLEFEAETLTTIKSLKEQLSEERQQHAMLLSSTGEMQTLVSGLQSEKAVLAEELEALRATTSEQIRAALTDSAMMQQQNLRLEATLATLKQEADARIAEAEAKAADSLVAITAAKEEAERREKLAHAQLEVTQEQLKEAVTEGTKASMQLGQMEKEFQELAQKALQDNMASENKLVELAERYQAAMAQLEDQLSENEAEIRVRLETQYMQDITASKLVAEQAEAALVTQQAEKVAVTTQLSALKEALVKSQEEAVTLAATVKEEQKLREELEAKAKEATEVAASLDKTYNVQLHFAERENSRLAGLLEEEQVRAQELSEKLARQTEEAGPAVERASRLESEVQALREEKERVQQAVEEQAEMNRSLKNRIAELDSNQQQTMSQTQQQLEEARQQLAATNAKLQEALSKSQEQAEINNSLQQRLNQLESDKNDSLSLTTQQLQEANHKLQLAMQRSEAAARAAQDEKKRGEQLANEVKHLKQQLDARGKDAGNNEQVVRELHQMRSDKEQFAKQVAMLQAAQAATLKALEDEKRRSHKAVEEQSERSKSLQGHVQELQRRLERHSKMSVSNNTVDQRQLAGKLHSVERALEEERQRATTLRQQLEERSSNMDRLARENQELQSERAMNTRLKRRLSELQRGWGSDNDQDRMLQLLKVESSKAEEMERAAQRALREKREVESRLERQVAASRQQVEELKAHCQRLEDRLRRRNSGDDDDDHGNGSGGARVADQLAQWKKDHEQMLDLTERRIRTEYEEKIAQMQRQLAHENAQVNTLRSEVQHREEVSNQHAAKALLSSISREQTSAEVSRLHDELQRHAREAAAAQEAAYIARCKLDEEYRARVAVEELMAELKNELQGSKVWDHDLNFRGTINRMRTREEEQTGKGWNFGVA